ncbi:MAG TPA: ProQ/FinO family protein [Gammaproteobacteria bacterium]|nr:ProQ/FinO family protein [Gammaproteobacteria bacterium]
MSNPSLQEQLQSLALASATDKKSRPQKYVANAKKPAPHKASPQKPAWLEYIYYGLELLKAFYPACFKEPSEVKPLKIGIKQDLVKQLSTREDIVISDKTCMIKSLSYYVTTLNYFKNMLEGIPRIDLNGESAGIVTAEEAQYSAEQHKIKLQKKSARALAKNTSPKNDRAELNRA